MLALPLLIALAVTADPAAPPAAPPDAPAAAPAAEEEVPTFQVAPPDAPGFETPPPPVPFRLEGFLAPEQTVAGAAARLGGSSRGLEGGLDVTLRHRGFVGGATIGGAYRHVSAGPGGDPKSLRLLGLVAGYGHARGLYRGEALLGWGVASDLYPAGGAGTLTRTGHFRSAQLDLDRAVCGGAGWRASLGLGLWYRDTFGLAASPSSHAEVGGGLRLGLEAGW